MNTQDFELQSALRLGALFLNVKKDLVKAKGVFRHCIANFPDDFRAYYNLATVLDAPGETQDYEGAAKLLRSAINCDGRVIESYGCLSGVLLKLRRPKEAAKVCMDGLLVIPTDPPCLYNFNVALRQLSRMNEAIDFSFRVLERSYSVDIDRESKIMSEGCGMAIAPTMNLHEPLNYGIVFMCVKWGTKYSAEYVNAMYYALKKHWTRDARALRLVCLTDDDTNIIAEVECRPFPSVAVKGGWRIWWLKACIFSPALMEDLGVKDDTSGGSWILYLDLDTVICGNIDFLGANPNAVEFSSYQKDTLYTFGTSIFANEDRKQGINSSILLWFEPAYIDCFRGIPCLFGLLERHYSEIVKVVYKLDHFLEMFLTRYRVRVVQLEDILPIFVDFQAVITCNGLRASCSLEDVRKHLNVAMVCFPLEPKPKEVLEDYAWIKEYFEQS